MAKLLACHLLASCAVWMRGKLLQGERLAAALACLPALCTCWLVQLRVPPLLEVLLV